MNETKLDPSINDREVYLVGYEIVRRDQKVNGRNGGGVCIYIRSNINYQVRDDLHSATLENLVVEIKKPRSKSVLVSTWYRPPDSPMSQFIEFEKMIGSFDAENVEYFLLGDLNVDLISTTESPTKNKLKEILDIYGIEQLINEPTRITISSRTLIDLCLTNTPTHVVDAGVVSLSISDHSLIYAIRKAHYVQGAPRMVHIRSMKQFDREHYLRDLEQKNWHNVYCSTDPNAMRKIWKENVMDIIDKHAPLTSRRVKKRKSPWITKELREKYDIVIA